MTVLASRRNNPIPNGSPVYWAGVKRAMRWILNGLTVVSLLLAMAVAGSWVRSYWWRDDIGVESRDGRSRYGAILPKGKLGLWISHADTPGFWARFPDHLGYRSYAANDAPPYAHTFIGLSWERQQGKDTLNQLPVIWKWTAVVIPDAYLLALFAALPAVRLYRHIRRRYRVLPGHCRKCGYDLRATPDRCPECGAMAAKVTA
jgi:hypothetical protein